DYYRGADIFCLPSVYEGMSNALLEAMASGLPCIVTPVSGSIDLVRSGAGTLGRTASEIAAAAATYLNDSTVATEHGAAARNIVQNEYSHTAVARRHYDLFREISRR